MHPSKVRKISNASTREEIKSFTPPVLNDDKKDDEANEPPREQKCKPFVYRPVARLGAFSVYMNDHITPCEGPLVNALGFDSLADNKTLSSLCTSVLGPEFVDYGKHSSAELDKELISISTELNNIAWIRSGINNNKVGE